MKVVTLCGSMRFFKEIQEIAIELETKHGCCAITPLGDTNLELDDTAIEKLAKANYKKIVIADTVYIVNIGGYIGRSVSEELRYARRHNKEIIYHDA